MHFIAFQPTVLWFHFVAFRMGVPAATFEDVLAMATKVGISDMIQGLPNQFHTQISADANQLSGGEKQRYKDLGFLIFNSIVMQKCINLYAL